nr:hypothetical protein [uncultured Brevundimonas sp.]
MADRTWRRLTVPGRLALLIALMATSACYPPVIKTHSRPDPAQILTWVREREAGTAVRFDGEVVELGNAVTTGDFVCSQRLDPACVPAAAFISVETRQARPVPLWQVAIAVPFMPLALASFAIDESANALGAGPRIYSPYWSASSTTNPCIRFVTPQKDGAWPHDSQIRADLYRRRLDLDGACLATLADPYSVGFQLGPDRARRLYFLAQARLRFEAFACVQDRPAEAATAPRVIVPDSIMTESREKPWPDELRAVFASADTYAVTPDLTQACAPNGGVRSDRTIAQRRVIEAWPLPTPLQITGLDGAEMTFMPPSR